MSIENVSVSMSRLRLAKIIKTSDDDDDQEAEPWSKSILFYQSHISPGMRKALVQPRRHINKKCDPSLNSTDNSCRPHQEPQPTETRSPRSGKKTFIPKDSDSESGNDDDDSLSDDQDDDVNQMFRIPGKQRGDSEDCRIHTQRPMGGFFNEQAIHPWITPPSSIRESILLSPLTPMFNPWPNSYYMQLQLYQQQQQQQQQHFIHMQQAVLLTRQMMISGNSAKIQRGRDLMVQKIKDHADWMAGRSPQRIRQNRVSPRPLGVIMVPYL